MSKTLSKILVICAMIAIFPLMIVGTAFAAYYSIDAKVNVFVYANAISNAEDAYAQVTFDGKAYKANEKLDIQTGHLNNVELAANAKGYDFKGWYVGDFESYTNAHATGTVKFDAGTASEIKFGMTDYQNLVAVFEIKTKTVTWNYAADPTNQETLTLTPPDGYTYTFDYGAALPTLSYEGDEWTFLGWNVNGEETIYTTANADVFANDNVELSALWKETAKITINYYDGATLLTSENPYENSLYSPLDPSADVFNLTLEAGYRYFWKDSDGFEVTQINTNKNVDLYLNRESITYSSAIDVDNDVTYIGNTDLTFTAANYSNLEKIFNVDNYKAQYSFWSVAIKVAYDDTEYTTAADLANAIITANPNATATANVRVTATVTKTIESIQFNTGDTVEFVALNSNNATVYISKEGSDTATTDIEDTCNCTAKVYNALLLNAKYYADIDNDGTREELYVKKIRININSRFVECMIDSETTFNDVLEALKTAGVDLVATSGTTLEIGSVQILCAVVNNANA